MLLIARIGPYLKNKYMKLLLLIISISLISSCATLQVASERNTKNVTSLGIELTYSGNENEVLPPMLDSAINIAMEKFNAEKHAYSVHKKLPKDKDYVTVDFTKGKIASKGQKAAGYIITAIGLAAPVVLISVESPLVVSFYYWPYNIVYSNVALSPSLSYDKTRDKKLNEATGALFAKTKPQVSKLVGKYSNGFYEVLIKIENQLKQH